ERCGQSPRAVFPCLVARLVRLDRVGQVGTKDADTTGKGPTNMMTSMVANPPFSVTPYGGLQHMTNAIKGEPIEILLVEDSPDDACFTMEALKDGKVKNRVNWVEDGEEALAFLRRQETHQSAPRPDLILLDLRLPKKNGHEVLEEIKQDPNLRRIPVVIM